MNVVINLHPINFIIVSGILQSMVLAAVMLFSSKGNRIANRLIGIFVFICSLHFLWGMVIDINLADQFKVLLWFPYSYLLALGPLLYFYTRTLCENQVHINVRDAFHFAPVSLEIFLQLYFIWEGILTDKVHYVVPGFLLFRMIELTGAAVSIFLYARRSLALITRYERAIEQQFSNQKDVTLGWLSRLIRHLTALWIFWLAFDLSFLSFFKFQMHFPPVYALLYLLLGTITYSVYWIGLQALSKSESLIEKPALQPGSGNTNVYSRLDKNEIKGYVQRLNELMRLERLYLHETLNLRLLAARMEADPNLVSYLLNNFLHKSFSDYVNEFRVEEVKCKINDPVFAYLKITEIGYECGFNSKATFNRVFKKYTGKTPTEYRNTLPGDENQEF